MRIERRRQQRTIRNRNSVYKRTEIDRDSDKKNNFVIFLFFSLVVGLFAFVFFSGFFKIKNISVATQGGGGADIQKIKKEISTISNGGVLKENILFFNSSIVEQEIQKNHLLKKITISKSYPNSLKVNIEEYKVVLAWLVNDNKYLVNEKGKITDVSITDPVNLPKVIDKKNIEVGIGKTVASSEFINYINYIYSNFKPTVGAEIIALEIKENLNEITVISGLGFYVIFDTTRDPEIELRNLQIAIKTIAGKKINYIDMRVENKIYYK